MPAKRERTVEGSCWPCKQRRVKCDLVQPRCRRCVLSGAKCCYDKILVRWNSRPTKGAPITYQLPIAGLLHGLSQDKPLAAGDMRALEYFQGAFWPLLSTAARPCPPPIGLAMASQPVLLAMCELAEAHRARLPNKDPQALQHKRLSCLASVREQLRHSASNAESLSHLLVAVLLLYFLDGFIDCSHQSASTASHQAGVRAIVDHLGGFPTLIDKGQRDTSMLMSEFASTDLTRALLDDRVPCFPASIWNIIERGTVWWEQSHYGETSLASVFGVLAEMAFYRHSVLHTNTLDPSSLDKIQAFERALQPSCLALALDHLRTPTPYLVPDADADPTTQTMAFTRAFQHTALIYLYRALCGLPARHCLVQQHVQSCLTWIRGIGRTSKAHNCIIFPLYVSGAHAFGIEQQEFVLGELDSIYQSLRFSSLLSIRAALEGLWAEETAQQGDWTGMFVGLCRDVLVL